MKKLLSSVLVLSLASAAVFASGVENKTNLNQGYIRNPSRNAENERPEAAFYNIAGTAFINDGFYIEAGNQVVFKDYSNELVTGDSYSKYGVNDYRSHDDDPVYLYPDFDIVYKKGNLAFFGTFGLYAGGGHLFYENGTSATSLLFLSGADSLKKSATKNGLAAKAALSASEQYKAGIIAAAGGATWEDITTLMNTPDAYLDPENLAKKTALSESYTSYENYAKLAVQYDGLMTEEGKAATASLAMAQNHSLDVTSITYGGQAGLAFRPWDWISFSGAYRYTYGTQEMELKCNDATFKAINKSNKISYDAHGFGQSVVFGIHAKPRDVEGLDVAVQYQTLSRIDYDVEHVTGDVAEYYNITDDTTFRTDLPAVLNIGIGYKVVDSLYLSSSFNYYFNDFAHQDNILAATDYDNSWELAIGADWRICKFVGFSCGASYGHQGITDTSNSTFNPVLNNVVFGGGFEIFPTENLTLTVAGLYTRYDDADYYLNNQKSSATRTVLSKEVTNIAFGATYRFPLK